VDKTASTAGPVQLNGRPGAGACCLESMESMESA
jgi:hypothetical protein